MVEKKICSISYGEILDVKFPHEMDGMHKAMQAPAGKRLPGIMIKWFGRP